MCSRQSLRVNLAFCPSHTACGFQLTDGVAQLSIN
jgi:hypothetical protein